MPDGHVTAGVVALAGKLPAHGDFVRRGGPAALLGTLDRWLDAELGGAMAAGIMLEDAVDALGGWRFAVADQGGVSIVAAAASVDAVGRAFPLLATVTTAQMPGRDEAERWCEAATGAIPSGTDADADTVLALLAAIAPPAPGEPPIGTGWWRSDAPATRSGTTLPRDAAFRALVTRDQA